ncbi:MAG: ABC transporter permease [Planctomycetota bacterium]
MIWTVVKISLLRLWNTKSELLLIFLVPILFFSVFAMIFSRGVGRKPGKIRVSIINDDTSPRTENLAREFAKRDELKMVTGIGKTVEQWPIEKLSKRIISQHNAEVVVYFPAGYSRPNTFDETVSSMIEQSKSIQILHEGTNPISAQVIEAALAQSLVKFSEQNLVAISPTQGLSNAVLAPVRLASTSSESANTVSATKATAGPGFNRSIPTLEFEQQNIFASNKHNPKIAMYAAGIAVMFLLFSSSGAGASLLEEKEAGTLDRLMTSRLTLTQLLVGKWVYITGLGFVQISTMFLWGQLVFNVDLLGHLSGFTVMALATSSASASFALLLAAVCRSRNQLNGISLVLVLGMSALGGSMIPRYIMSESMQQLGRYTFNGWALDGFKKIFWYDLSISAIQTELVVLLVIAISFAMIANLLLRRWSLNG